MEITDLTTLVSTVGFPIGMCLLFFHWFTTSYKQEQDNTREVINDLKEAVNALTITISKKGAKDE